MSLTARVLAWLAVALSGATILGALIALVVQLGRPDPWPEMAVLLSLGVGLPAVPGLLVGVAALRRTFARSSTALAVGILAVALAAAMPVFLLGAWALSVTSG